MNLKFLPDEILNALSNLNINFLSEIRIRKGQAVIIEYNGEYKYINNFGVSKDGHGKIIINDIDGILSAATGGSIYAYAEQLKLGFITLDGGIRIGIAAEYVCDGNKVIAVRHITSLNIRIPHDIAGCAIGIYKNAFNDGLKNLLIFSAAGYGKTTMLRDLARLIATKDKLNVLVFDERNEIAAFDSYNFAYNLGDRVDVVRGSVKLQSFENAVRAMKPHVIGCDELYGDDDIKAIELAIDCGIKVLASSHTQNRDKLKKLPFDCYAELVGIGKPPIVYDKNFTVIGDYNFNSNTRLSPFAQ
jgi:stage III sporulation protein AA